MDRLVPAYLFGAVGVVLAQLPNCHSYARVGGVQ